MIEEVSLSSSDESMEFIELPDVIAASAQAPGPGNLGGRLSP